MSSQKVSALTSLGAGQAPADFFYVVDVSAGTAGSKKTTLNDVFAEISLNTNDGAISFGGVAAPTVSAAGKGKLYFDSTANRLKLSNNAEAYDNVVIGNNAQLTTSSAFYRVGLWNGTGATQTLTSHTYLGFLAGTAVDPTRLTITGASTDFSAGLSISKSGGNVFYLTAYSAGWIWQDVTGIVDIQEYNATNTAWTWARGGGGTVDVGHSRVVSTSATSGFFWIPRCAGTPTGTPAKLDWMGGALGAGAALVVDSATNKLWGYYGGAWNSLSGVSGGSPGGSNKQVQFNNSSAFGGAAGFEYQSGASPNVSITAQGATHTALSVIGAASNSAAVLASKLGSGGTGNLFEAQNSSGTSVFSVTPAGVLGTGNTFVASSTTQALMLGYNNSVNISGAANKAVLIGRNIQLSGASAVSNSVLISSGGGVSDGITLTAGKDLSDSVVIGSWSLGPQSYAGQSVFIGSGNSGGALQNNGMVVIGTGMAYPEGVNSISIGSAAQTRADYGLTIGFSSSVWAADGIAIGRSATVPTSSHTSSIAIGRDATTTAANQLVIGSSGFPVSDVYLGKGATNAAPTSYTINGTGGSGTNISGGALLLAGGRGTGNATGGSIDFQVAPAGSSGSTLNPLSTIASFTSRKTFNFISQSPTAADGDFFYSSDTNSLRAMTGSLLTSLSGAFLANTASTTVTATTDTTLTGASPVGTDTLPAIFLKVGTVITIEASGVFSTGGSGGTPTFKLKLGGTTVVTSVAPQPLAANHSNRFWRLIVKLHCRTTGLTGAVFATGTAEFDDNSGTATIFPLSSSSSATVDTTGTLQIVPTLAWDVSGNSLTVQIMKMSVQ